MTYNYLSNQVDNQIEISIENDDLENIQEVFLSASSDIVDQNSYKVAGTSSQRY